jgi:protein involved in temperature-dependent protein secretion
LGTAGCTKAPSTPQSDLARLDAERDPARLDALADQLVVVGDARRAAQYYRLAIDLGAAERDVLPKLVSALVRDRQYQLAALQCQEHLRRQPADAPPRFILASLYMAIGDAVSARRQLDELLRRQPENVQALYASAVLSRDDENNAERADADFRAYLRLEPQGPHADEARASLLSPVR